MKSRPVGDELFHTDRRTDMKPIVDFRNFANVRNKTLGLNFIERKWVFLSTYCKEENGKHVYRHKVSTSWLVCYKRKMCAKETNCVSR